MGRFALLFLGGSLLALVVGPSSASIYSPDDPRFTVPVGEDGRARPLGVDEFRGAMAVLMNAQDSRQDPRKEGDRKPFLDRIAAAKGKKLSASQTAALAADLLRAGRANDALNELAPRLRDRNPDYFVYTTYATIRAAAGDWQEALRYHSAALFDSEMPATVKGLSKAQRDWWEKLDRDYVPHYYRLRFQETSERRGKSREELERLDETEGVFPLFPAPDRQNPNPAPVRFVNEAGLYEPGKLATAERVKLPHDAIPIVQQLLLWFPAENRLYWLLAELYAAEGDFAASWKAFQSISWGRAYGNRKVFMDHRQAVEAALDAQPRKASADEPLFGPTPAAEPASPGTPEAPISMRTIWIYFGVVALIALFALIRMVSRRVRGHCGPAG